MQNSPSFLEESKIWTDFEDTKLFLCLTCTENIPCWEKIYYDRERRCMSWRYKCQKCGLYTIPVSEYVQKRNNISVNLNKVIFEGNDFDCSSGNNQPSTHQPENSKNNNEKDGQQNNNNDSKRLFETWKDINWSDQRALGLIWSKCIFAIQEDYNTIIKQFSEYMKTIKSNLNEIKSLYKQTLLKVDYEHSFIKMVFQNFYFNCKNLISMRNIDNLQRIFPSKIYYGEETNWWEKANLFKKYLNKFTLFKIGNDTDSSMVYQFLLKNNSYPEYKTSTRKYLGGIVNGKREGKGVCAYSDGIFVGTWRNNKKEGVGKFIFNDGSYFEGEYKNNSREGNGVWIGKNGNKYKGKYEDNYMNGWGEFHWNNGDYYQGEFLKGHRHGYGILNLSKGIVVKGIWELGKLVKKDSEC